MRRGEKLVPNPERHEIRVVLARIRRLGFEANLNYKHSHDPDELEKRKNLRRHERVLSRKLALCPPFLKGDQEVPVYPVGHFKRFRHSSRFKNFMRVWNASLQRIQWRRR